MEEYPGSEILGSGSPRVVLARLVDGDPLEIGPRSQERIRTRALFAAWNRVWLRSVARVAHAAPAYRGKPALEVWLQQRIDASIEDLLREDREEERLGIPPEEPWDSRYAFVSETLGMAPELARKACIAFNDLPEEVRQTYFAVAIERKTVHRWVAEGHGPPARVEEHLRKAFEALSQPPWPGRDPEQRP